MSQLFRQPKFWSFTFSISPSKEYSALIFFRIDWFELLAFQGTLKNLLQHPSLKASILWPSAFFIVWLTSVHDYWKDHSLDYMDLCQQSDVFAFHTVEICHSFPAKKQSSFISWLKSLTTLKPFTVWILTNCRQLLTADHLTCLLRNLYAGQEATVRTWYGTIDWLRIEKGVQQGCLLSLCLFNLPTEHIM